MVLAWMKCCALVQTSALEMRKQRIAVMSQGLRLGEDGGGEDGDGEDKGGDDIRGSGGKRKRRVIY